MPTIASTPEMMDSVNWLILADRWVTIEGIFEQLGISVFTVHRIVHGHLAFSNVSHCWVSKRLMLEHKASESTKNSGNHQTVWLGTAAISFLTFHIWSDFHLFGHHKEFFHGTKSSSISKWQETQHKEDFYAEGIQKLVFQWEKSI